MKFKKKMELFMGFFVIFRSINKYVVTPHQVYVHYTLPY